MFVVFWEMDLSSPTLKKLLYFFQKQFFFSFRSELGQPRKQKLSILLEKLLYFSKTISRLMFFIRIFLIRILSIRIIIRNFYFVSNKLRLLFFFNNIFTFFWKPLITVHKLGVLEHFVLLAYIWTSEYQNTWGSNIRQAKLTKIQNYNKSSCIIFLVKMS